MIEPGNDKVSIRQQCELLGLSRATYYYEPCKESDLNLKLMSLIDKQYTKTPFYGCLRITAYLNHEGYAINSKRVRRLMRLMGLLAIYPKHRTTIAGAGHKIYPYLLRDLAITRPNQVWSADITYIPMLHGFMYLVAIIDWYSRYVVAWQLSNTLDGLFCLDVLEQALTYGRPEIFNTDQGAQFTATAFTSRLEAARICISMDGQGRALDNVFLERLWRSVKQEHVYLYAYETVIQLEKGLRDYFRFYNQERPHQSLDYQAPVEVYLLVSVYPVAA